MYQNFHNKLVNTCFPGNECEETMVMLGKLSLFVNFGLHKVGHTIGCICPCCFVVISLVTCERRHIKQEKTQMHILHLFPMQSSVLWYEECHFWSLVTTVGFTQCCKFLVQRQLLRSRQTMLFIPF